MAGDIEEAGVRFIVENLESYLAQVKIANGATADIGTKTEAAAVKSGVAWGKIGKAAGLGALAVGAAGLVIAGALLKIAGDFDDAIDAIAVGTGATGTELAGLEESFEKVFTSIPADGGDIAAAMVAISQKTGATGQPLEDLTSSVLELSRITGTDLNTNVESVTDLIGKWGISAEGAVPFLDELFRISQESGVPVSELATALGENKEVIDQLGMSLPEAALFVGNLGKAGIDSDGAFQGMKIALKTMAKEGITDTKAGLKEYFDRIKGAKTDAEGTRIAVELFGRSGVTMAGQIRDGRFDLEKFREEVGNNKNTIRDTARQTDDWKEKLTILRNQGMVALKPVAEAVFKAVGDAVEAIKPALDAFLKWFETDIMPPVRDMIRLFQNDVAPALRALGRVFVNDVMPVVVETFKAIGEAISGVVAVMTGVIELINALVHGRWGDAWTAVEKIATGAFDVIAALPKAMFRVLETNLGDGFRDLMAKLGEWLDTYVLAPFKALIGFGAAGAGYIRDLAGAIRDKLSGMLEAVRGWVDTYVLGPFRSLAGFAAAGTAYITDLLGAAQDKLSGMLDAVRGWVDTYVLGPFQSIAGIGKAGIDLVTDFTSSIFTAIGGATERVESWAKDIGAAIYNGAKDGLGDLGGAIWDWVSGAINSAIGSLEGGVNGVIAAVNRALEFHVGLDTPFGEISVDIDPPDIGSIRLPRVGGGGAGAPPVPAGGGGGGTVSAVLAAAQAPPAPSSVPAIGDILSRISGSLPGVVSNLAGLQGGGVTYQVSAVYTNPQSPQSIRLDLEAIAMMASA